MIRNKYVFTKISFAMKLKLIKRKLVCNIKESLLGRKVFLKNFILMFLKFEKKSSYIGSKVRID
ncbi:MAG: hypothetical protein C0425_02490 [Chlorobiaceae bacterium]|nr:hypothetical protein [Chlorobiaceae bacterium]MBA4309189.1 hypothetical protein [Chlorobiaceae bacterium]